MSDVFVSYASEDRPKAQALAQALEARGWSVWWDRQILAGQEFDEAIQKALTEAKCILVLWSTHSVKKRWVRDEAAEGADRGILVPVLVEDVRIPLGFRRIQAERLREWDGTSVPPGLDHLIAAVAAVVQKGPGPARKAAAFSPLSWRKITFLLLTLPALAAVLFAWVLVTWRVPTHVEVSLLTDHAVFAVGQSETSPAILKAVPFSSVTFEKFSSVSLGPKTMEIADPRQYDFATDSIPGSAWKGLAFTNPTVRFVAGSGERQPKVTLEKRSGGGQAAGILDSVYASEDTRVTLTLRERPTKFTMTLAGKDAPSAVVSLREPVQVTGDYVMSQGTTGPVYEGEASLTYRVQLRKESPLVRAEGRSGELVISLTVPPEKTQDLFVNGEVPITTFDVRRLDESGKTVSSVIGQAQIRYPDYLDINPRTFEAPAFLDLRDLGPFYIQEIRLDEAGKGFTFRMDGIAGHVVTKSGASRTDYRLTKLDTLKHNPVILSILTVLFWGVPTTLGAYRLAKELKA